MTINNRVDLLTTWNILGRYLLHTIEGNLYLPHSTTILFEWIYLSFWTAAFLIRFWGEFASSACQMKFLVYDQWLPWCRLSGLISVLLDYRWQTLSVKKRTWNRMHKPSRLRLMGEIVSCRTVYQLSGGLWIWLFCSTDLLNKTLDKPSSYSTLVAFVFFLVVSYF